MTGWLDGCRCVCDIYVREDLYAYEAPYGAWQVPTAITVLFISSSLLHMHPGPVDRRLFDRDPSLPASEPLTIDSQAAALFRAAPPLVRPCARGPRGQRAQRCSYSHRRRLWRFALWLETGGKRTTAQSGEAGNEGAHPNLPPPSLPGLDWIRGFRIGAT